MSSSKDYQMKSSAQRKVKALAGNLSCCDCGSPNPDWACLKFGTLFCLQCSGVHRSLGTHISFVRSVDMDSWSKEQIKVMKIGGNQQCNDFLQQHAGIDPINTSIREKYDNPVAQFYKDLLKSRLLDQPEPSLADVPKMPINNNNNKDNKDIQDDTTTIDGSDDDVASTTTDERDNNNNNKENIPPSVSSGISSLRPVMSRLYMSFVNRTTTNVR